MNKPPVFPELYTGEKSWDEWYDHFDSIATVCEWDDATKLSWLRVRLSGRAATTFRRLPEETWVNFMQVMKALWERFEPESKRELYMAELQTRMKKRNEDWAVYGEDLKQLADKAYPDLEDAARERFAMNHYLTQLTSPQVAFSVRQAKPKTVDEAVRLTLEMESYLQPQRPGKISSVELEDSHCETETIAAVTHKTNPDDSLRQLLRRIDGIETELKCLRRPSSPESGRDLGVKSTTRRMERQRRPLECWSCGASSHKSRDCQKKDQ